MLLVVAMCAEGRVIKRRLTITLQSFQSTSKVDQELILVVSQCCLVIRLTAVVLVAGCSQPVATNFAEPQVTSSFTAEATDAELTASELTKRNPELGRQLVSYKGPERPGTIVVRTVERKLYYILSDGQAIRYPVGVGRYGKQWQGRAQIEGKHVHPAWSPPDNVLRDNPRLPAIYPGGSPDN
ncbi:MAG: L,D-transpeptidase family protein, partial [Burkholderiales bacterium]|nr:L,D-transpeptidase family protein [Burkholderiales bacterium]